MRFTAIITYALVLLALIGDSTVPDGFMRVASPEGMRIVLCTADGMQDAWLTREGDVVPAPEHSGQDGAHCVQVMVAGVELQPLIRPVMRLPLWSDAAPRRRAQLPASWSDPDHNHARAPPLLV